jgi:hypothetical protein
MPTLFDRIPTLVERILGADLIAIGTVVGLREVRPAEGFEIPRVSGLFEVQLDDVLRGERPEDRVLVRVLGDGEDERAAWSVPLEEGRRLLLLLARDVAPELPEGVFAPYFESSFPVEDDSVRVPEETLDERAKEITGAKRDTVPLDGFRRLADVVGAEREKRLRELDELVPADLRERPYPDTEEQPAVEDGRPLPEEVPAEPTPEGGSPADVQSDE